MFAYILFDLDGTISDPKAGICGSVQYALKSFGIEETDMEKLEPFIGPPLRDSFMEYYGFTPEQAQLAVEKYRERFSVTGKYENTLYPGMAELLRDLWKSGAHLAIASSKPTVFVEDILRYFGIRQYFEIVVGSELDGSREKKEDIVTEVLRQFAKGGAADPSEVVMIGDRKYDVEGAIAAGTHHIGVGYGYASAGELQEAGAEIIVKDVEGLRRVLLGTGPASGNAASSVTGAEEKAGTENPVHQVYAERDRQPHLQPPPFIGSQGQSPHQNDGEGWREAGAPAGQQGVYSDYAARYRRPKTETRGKRIAKAVGISLLAMFAYYIAASVITTAVTLLGVLFFGGDVSDSAYYFWLNLGNGAGMIAGFAVCFGIWHKDIRVRPAKTLQAISLIPMVTLAASLAMGMNGLLSLIELYKYSPKFQEVSQIQMDIPVWLGVLTYGILAPLGEETVFRGVLYGQLKKVSNVPAAIVLSGLAFGLFHGNLVQAVYATALGIVLALVYEIYGSILAAMLFHCIANLFVYVILDLTEIGGIFVIPFSCMFFLLVSAVTLVLMVKWQKNGD